MGPFSPWQLGIELNCEDVQVMPGLCSFLGLGVVFSSGSTRVQREDVHRFSSPERLNGSV